MFNGNMTRVQNGNTYLLSFKDTGPGEQMAGAFTPAMRSPEARSSGGCQSNPYSNI
jgi:hypothetical protein